jgi:hypothetical protein
MPFTLWPRGRLTRPGKSAITSVNSGFGGKPAGCGIELLFAAMFPLFAER